MGGQEDDAAARTYDELPKITDPDVSKGWIGRRGPWRGVDDVAAHALATGGCHVMDGRMGGATPSQRHDGSVVVTDACTVPCCCCCC